MDIKQSFDFRYKRLKGIEYSGSNKYDYAKHGVLNRIIPKVLFKGNSILVTFLQLIDLRIIMMLKTVDTIKYFKRISDY